MNKGNVVEFCHGRVGVVMKGVGAVDRYCARVEEEFVCEREANELVIAE